MRAHQNPPNPEARSTKTRKDENSGVILAKPLITARAARTQEMIKAGLLILMASLGAKMTATARVIKHKIPEKRLVLTPGIKAICGCKKASCMEVRAKNPQVIFSPRLIATAYPPEAWPLQAVFAGELPLQCQFDQKRGNLQKYQTIIKNYDKDCEK